jgi:hypothetical protein
MQVQASVPGRGFPAGRGSGRPRRGAPKGQGQGRAPPGTSIRVTLLAAGRNKAGGHLLPRRHPPQALAGPVVEKRVDPVKLGLANVGKGRLLGVQPADQAVGVLVRAPLPGVVGLGEIDVQPQVAVPGPRAARTPCRCRTSRSTARTSAAAREATRSRP